MTICVDQDRLCTDLRADGRVRSRLRSAETVRLDRYAQAELVDIVQYRVEHGFDTGLVADGADGAIADLAAGDAREAISLLRHGARNVRQGHAEELTADVVHEAASKAREAVLESGYSTSTERIGFGLSIVASSRPTAGSATRSTSGGARFEITGVKSADS